MTKFDHPHCETPTAFLHRLRSALEVADHLEECSLDLRYVVFDLIEVIDRALGEGDYDESDVVAALDELEGLMCIHPSGGRKRRTLGEATRQGAYGIVGGYDLLTALRALVSGDTEVAT